MALCSRSPDPPPLTNLGKHFDVSTTVLERSQTSSFVRAPRAVYRWRWMWFLGVRGRAMQARRARRVAVSATSKRHRAIWGRSCRRFAPERRGEWSGSTVAKPSKAPPKGWSLTVRRRMGPATPLSWPALDHRRPSRRCPRISSARCPQRRSVRPAPLFSSVGRLRSPGPSQTAPLSWSTRRGATTSRMSHAKKVTMAKAPSTLSPRLQPTRAARVVSDPITSRARRKP